MKHPVKPRISRVNARSSWHVMIGMLSMVVLLAACGGIPSPTTGGASPGSTTTRNTPTPAATPFQAGPDADAALSQCDKSSAGGCFSPEQVQTFYNLNPLYARGYDGKGTTIVIVMDHGSPTIKDDLHVFDQTFGLPDPPSFDIIAPLGGNTLNSDAAFETTLDVEWAHAIAPGANIVLLVSPADEWPQYEQVTAYGIEHQLGQVYSFSLLDGEPNVNDSCDGTVAMLNSYDQNIFEPAVANHITMLAASGDDGATNLDCTFTHDYNYPNASWPASDPLVTAVGGTQMALDDDAGHYGKEGVWNHAGEASGGGVSRLFSEPDWQKNLPDQSSLNGKRGVPDVSWGAAANFPIYYSYNAKPGWRVCAGTSVSTPQWAGLVAIADQMAGKPLGFINPALYQLAGKGFHDITTGNNSDHGVTGFDATPGWDMATGWGTPNAALLAPLLVAAVEQLGG